MLKNVHVVLRAWILLIDFQSVTAVLQKVEEVQGRVIEELEMVELRMEKERVGERLGDVRKNILKLNLSKVPYRSKRFCSIFLTTINLLFRNDSTQSNNRNRK